MSRGGLVLGVDEAGRGPVIGPMAVGAVLIAEDREEALRQLGVADSKKLSPRKREAARRSRKRCCFQIPDRPYPGWRKRPMGCVSSSGCKKFLKFAATGKCTWISYIPPGVKIRRRYSPIPAVTWKLIPSKTQPRDKYRWSKSERS